MRATLFTILAALLIASAQQVATQPPAAPQKSAAKSAAQKKGTAGPAGAKKVYSFTDTVQLVVVDVFAKDKNGNPVPGLKAADFAITEDGKPQVIKVSEYQELKSDPIAIVPATLEKRPEAAAPLPPATLEIKSVTSNQIAPTPPAPPPPPRQKTPPPPPTHPPPPRPGRQKKKKTPHIFFFPKTPPAPPK